MEELKSKNRVLLVLILAFLIVIVAFSVSIFSFTKRGTKDNIINFGSLALTLSEGTEISLSDTYPMTDSEGVALTGYSFTLENTGTANATYSIYLDNVAVDSSDTKLDDKYVKYALVKNSSTATAKYLTSLGSDKARAIDTGTLNSRAKNTYNLKLWVTADIDGDIANQVWKGKLRITGEQVH